MHFGFHSSEKAAANPTNPRAFPEHQMLAACVVLLALTIFLAQGFDDPLFRAIYGVTDTGAALLWRGGDQFTRLRRDPGPCGGRDRRSLALAESRTPRVGCGFRMGRHQLDRRIAQVGGGSKPASGSSLDQRERCSVSQRTCGPGSLRVSVLEFDFP